MPRKPKHTLAEVVAALERFRSGVAITPFYREIIEQILQGAVNQRTASGKNKGRPRKGGTVVESKDSRITTKRLPL